MEQEGRTSIGYGNAAVSGRQRYDDPSRGAYRSVGPALETIAEAGTPLLAGFCVTVIGVVAATPEMFWWASLTMLLLTVAAIAFVVSINIYYWTRVHLIKSGERGLTEYGGNPYLTREYCAYRSLARRLHVLFQAGIMGLFAGLATAMVPRSEGDWPRLVAVGACCAMFVFVSLWTFGYFYKGLVKAADRGASGRRPLDSVETVGARFPRSLAAVILWWFRPGERSYRSLISQEPSSGGSLAATGSTRSP